MNSNKKELALRTVTLRQLSGRQLRYANGAQKVDSIIYACPISLTDCNATCPDNTYTCNNCDPPVTWLGCPIPDSVGC